MSSETLINAVDKQIRDQVRRNLGWLTRVCTGTHVYTVGTAGSKVISLLEH